MQAGAVDNGGSSSVHETKMRAFIRGVSQGIYPAIYLPRKITIAESALPSNFLSSAYLLPLVDLQSLFLRSKTNSGMRRRRPRRRDKQGVAQRAQTALKAVRSGRCCRCQRAFGAPSASKLTYRLGCHRDFQQSVTGCRCRVCDDTHNVSRPAKRKRSVGSVRRSASRTACEPAAQRGLEESLRKATTFATGTMQQKPLGGENFSFCFLTKNHDTDIVHNFACC